MIKIVKPKKSPSVLTRRGTRRKNTHCQNYTQHPAEYRTGQSKFCFDATIYGHQEVKDALVAAQYSKCCFCESQIGHDGDVEHYRPKGACCQTTGGMLQRPGYYWLAYDWNNLLLCCAACNQRHKRNLFPLENESQRAKTHSDDVSIERPLFINPAIEDPELLISFRKEIPYAVNGNKRGRITIEALGLKRAIMNERRREYLRILDVLSDIVAQEHTQPMTPELKKTIADAKQLLLESTADKALFAGMVRARKRGWREP